MMTDTENRCQATTKSGTQCKNRAKTGQYCHIHQSLAEKPKPSQAEFDALVAEINELAVEIKALEAKFEPPPFSAKAMVNLLKENLDKFTPEMRLTLVSELKESFEGAEAKDFLDPDTWKGMWYLLNYSVENQTAGIRDTLKERLAQLPGVELMTDLQNSLEGASPKDFLELDTWKGIWYIVNYSMKFEAEKVKQRLLGEEELDEA